MNDLETTRSNLTWELCCRHLAGASGIEWPAPDDRLAVAKAIGQITIDHGPTVLALHQRVMPRLEAMPPDAAVVERLLPEVLLGEWNQLQQEVAL